MDEFDKPLPRIVVLSQLEGKVKPASKVAPKKFKEGRVPRPLSDKAREQSERRLFSDAFPEKKESPRRSVPFEDAGFLGEPKTKPVRPPSSPQEGPRKKVPKEPTKERLWNVAMYQIEQREMSMKGVRDILQRRMTRWLYTRPAEEASVKHPLIEAMIEEVLQALVKKNYVNDARYAEMKVRGWRDRGLGERRIEMELRKKGITGSMVQDALREVDQEQVDIEDDKVRSFEVERLAAETFAQKRKLGPWRREAMPKDYKEASKIWRREAGMLARAGFGMDIINELLRAPQGDEFSEE